MDMNQRDFFSNMSQGQNDGKEESVPVTKQMINETLTKCYLLTGLAKLKGINQYISDITENECKFLIFGHHTEVLNNFIFKLILSQLDFKLMNNFEPIYV